MGCMYACVLVMGKPSRGRTYRAYHLKLDITCIFNLNRKHSDIKKTREERPPKTWCLCAAKLCGRISDVISNAKSLLK